MVETTEFLQHVGGYYWDLRWHALIYRDPVSPSDMIVHKLAWDMNADGAATISDVWLWVQWFYLLPGDYLVIGVMKFLPAVAQFLEIGPDSLAGWGAGIVSGIFWLLVLAIYGLAEGA